MSPISADALGEAAMRLPTVIFRTITRPLGTEVNGIPQFEAIEVAKWSYPGVPDYWEKPVAEFFKSDPRFDQVFRPQYEQFKAGATKQFTGCPLDECAVIPRTLAEQYKFLGFQSVEQLVAADPTQVEAIPEGIQYQTKARRWLAAAKKNGDTAKVFKELEDLKERNKFLEEELKKVNAKFIEFTGGEKQ